MAEEFENYEAMVEAAQRAIDDSEVRTGLSIDPFAPAGMMLQQMQRGELSSEELLRTHIRRIEARNPALHAIVSPRFDEALIAARRADRERSRGREAPLLGLPITVKDCINVAGAPTTAGVPDRRHAIAEADAPAVSQLREAGAVIIAKTNVPPDATGWESENELFGRTVNPWDDSRTPGGSTGGGAAAVAAGLTPIDLGSDFVGSIRIPAAFCGIYGHKPSLSAAVATGHFPGNDLPNPTTGLAVVGPLSRSAEDLDLVLKVVGGPQIGEDIAWRLAFPPPRWKRLQDFRVAILPIPDWLPVETSIREAAERVADQLRGAGATVAEIAPECFTDLRAYHADYVTMMAVISSARLLPMERHWRAEASRAEEDEFSIAYAEGLELSAQDYVILHDRREGYRAQLRTFFKGWDILLTPANILNAYPYPDASSPQVVHVDGREERYDLQSVFPGLANFSAHPATAFPAGMTDGRLPIGLQALGPYLEDRTAIEFTRLVADLMGGFSPPPAFLERS